MPRPLRVMVFPARPDCILTYVPEGETFRLPELTPPFDRYDVAAACREAGIEARVVESTPGRFTESVRVAINAERAARTQQQRLEDAARIVKIRESPTATPAVKRQADALARKYEVDDQIRKLKVELGQARANAHTKGVYLPVHVYRDKERLLEKLKLESQALQAHMGKLRDEAKNERRQHDDVRRRSDAEIFLHVAKSLLSQEALDEIWAEVSLLQADPTDQPNQTS